MKMTFDENDYLALRKRYRQAVKNKEKSFKFKKGIFKDQEFLTNFAKYVLEYLESDPRIKAVMDEPDPDE